MWDRPMTERRPASYMLGIYFPEDFPDPKMRGYRIVPFRDEASAEMFVRHECFTYCPVHCAYARPGTVTMLDGARKRVVAVKEGAITVGWRLADMERSGK